MMDSPWTGSWAIRSCDAKAGGRVAGAADQRCDDPPAGPVPAPLNVGSARLRGRSAGLHPPPDPRIGVLGDDNAAGQSAHPKGLDGPSFG